MGLVRPKALPRNLRKALHLTGVGSQGGVDDSISSGGGVISNRLGEVKAKSGNGS